jgi:hypothetical protein
MSKAITVLPLELTDSEVKTLIVETLLKAQEVFPKMNLEDLEIGSRQPTGAQGVLWAWRISTNLGAFDISNNHRLVRIAPESESRMKKIGKLPDVAKVLFEAWCPDWKALTFESDKKKDPGGWIHGRQVQLPDEVCIFQNTWSLRFYDGGDLETFSRTDLSFSKKGAVKLSAIDAAEAVSKIAKNNKLEFSDAPELKAELHDGTVRACYVARGINSLGYSANVKIDAETGDVLRADK